MTARKIRIEELTTWDEMKDKLGLPSSGPGVCAIPRSLKSKTTPKCELPQGHIGEHFGRSRAGNWYGWENHG